MVAFTEQLFIPFLFHTSNPQVGITKTELGEKNKEKVNEKANDIEDDPWAGLSYTIDDETGTAVFQFRSLNHNWESMISF